MWRTNNSAKHWRHNRTRDFGMYKLIISNLFTVGWVNSPKRRYGCTINALYADSSTKNSYSKVYLLSYSSFLAKLVPSGYCFGFWTLATPSSILSNEALRGKKVRGEASKALPRVLRTTFSRFREKSSNFLILSDLILFLCLENKGLSESLIYSTQKAACYDWITSFCSFFKHKICTSMCDVLKN